MADMKAAQCEFHLIKAWLPCIKPSFKAAVHSISDITIEGMTNTHRIMSMRAIDHSRYLVNSHGSGSGSGSQVNTYVVDMVAMTVDVVAMTWNGVKSLLNEDIVVTLFCGLTPMHVFKDKTIIGTVDVKGRQTNCANGYPITDRWIQELYDDIFIIDIQMSLYRLKWSDIKQGKYDRKSLVDTQVEDFYATKDRLAILKMDGTLNLGIRRLDLRTIRPEAAKIMWTIVIRAARHWIVSGDLDGQAIIASINDKTTFRRSLTINTQAFYRNMHSLHTVIDRRSASVMLACERDGFSHLLSVDSRGVILLIQSLNTMIPATPEYSDKKFYALIQSVCRCQRGGDIIVAGVKWMKLVSIRIK